VSESSMADTESCEVDSVTAGCLVRRRPGGGEGLDLSEFVERSSFLLKEILSSAHVQRG